MTQRRRSWSIAATLVLAGLLVEGVMLTLLLASNTKIMADRLAALFDTRLVEVERLLATSLAVPLVQRDYGTLQDILDTVRRDRGIEYLILNDYSGQVMAASGRPPPDHRPADVSDGHRDREIAIALAGQTYGHLRFGVSTAFFDEARASLLRIGIAIALAEALLSAAILSFIGYRLTRRLRAVTRTSEILAGGNLDARVDCGDGDDEISRLGRGFNAMADALRAQLVQSENATHALAGKTAELERSNADLEQFAYVASHDLQTPLRNIVSFAQLLEQRCRGRIDADADDFIRFIVDGGKQMTRLIADLLEYSRVTSQSAPLHAMAAGDAVSLALKNLKLDLDGAGAEVTVGDLPPVIAEQSHLASLFQNLLGNGLKYRAPDRKPLLSVTAERATGDQWRFAVTDNGIGIEPQYFDKIFDIFQRLNPAGGAEGTGIGLTLCRRIVHRFGGAIWLESTPDVGTTFFFTLRDGSIGDVPDGGSCPPLRSGL